MHTYRCIVFVCASIFTQLHCWAAEPTIIDAAEHHFFALKNQQFGFELAKSVHDDEHPNPRTAYILGLAYAEGFGVTRNSSKAKKYLYQARDNNHPKNRNHPRIASQATFALGHLANCEKNYVEARRLFKHCIESQTMQRVEVQFFRAHGLLAWYTYSGLGGKPEMAEADQHARIAYQQRCCEKARAQGACILRKLYKKSTDPLQRVLGERLLNEAASQTDCPKTAGCARSSLKKNMVLYDD